MNQATIDRLRILDQAATPGPWHVGEDEIRAEGARYAEWIAHPCADGIGNAYLDWNEPDRVLVGAMRAAFPQLLEWIELLMRMETIERQTLEIVAAIDTPHAMANEDQLFGFAVAMQRVRSKCEEALRATDAITDMMKEETR